MHYLDQQIIEIKGSEILKGIAMHCNAMHWIPTGPPPRPLLPLPSTLVHYEFHDIFPNFLTFADTPYGF